MIRRSARGGPSVRTLSLLSALWLLAGCSDDELPGAPGGPSFAAVAIDRTVLEPRPGAGLTVSGAPLTLLVPAHFQGATGGSLVLTVRARDRESPEGVVLLDARGVGSSADSITFEALLELPPISPWCGSYDEIAVVVGLHDPLRAGDAPIGADSVSYPVSGAAPAGPCLRAVDLPAAEAPLRWGAPLLLFGRALTADVLVSLPGAAQSDNALPTLPPPPSRDLPVDDDGYVLAFVPVGAHSGRLRLFAAGGEARYAADAAVELDVAATTADALEPNDGADASAGDVYLDAVDPYGDWGIYAFNPSLTLDEADRAPDPERPGYGVGDWFPLRRADPAADLCIRVQAAEPGARDVHLFVYGDAGALVGSSTEPGGVQSLRVSAAAGPEPLRVAVLPSTSPANQDAEAYAYEAGRCASSSGGTVERPLP